jgi:hypothetical protein
MSHPKLPALTDEWIKQTVFNGWATQTQIHASRIFLMGERARDAAERKSQQKKD